MSTTPVIGIERKKIDLKQLYISNLSFESEFAEFSFG